MKASFFLSLVLSSGCASSYTGDIKCLTKCGLAIAEEGIKMGSGWSCDSLQQLEDDIVELLPKVKGMPQNVCERLNGGNIFMHETRSWNYGRLEMSGITYCPESRLEVNYSRDPWVSSLPHELIHWVERCPWTEPGPPPYDNYRTHEQAGYHFGWVERGVEDFVKMMFNRSPYFASSPHK